MNKNQTFKADKTFSNVAFGNLFRQDGTLFIKSSDIAVIGPDDDIERRYNCVAVGNGARVYIGENIEVDDPFIMIGDLEVNLNHIMGCN